MTGIAPFTRSTARRLRNEATPLERRLWRQLRDLNHRLGTHFRRQAPIGRFIADFADLGRRLVIEVDGGGHGGARDAARDEWLHEQGFAVLRFWNIDIDSNIEGVMRILLDELEAAPPPHPSPTRGEGGTPQLSAAQTPEARASPPPRGEGLGVGGTKPGQGANP